MTAETPIVCVENLRKVYGGGWPGRQPITALQGVSLNAYPGEVFGLLGPNGAGKTTLIKTLLGIIQPSAGTANLFGIPVRSHAARRRVGYLPESLRIDRHHTATTALRFYGRMSGMDAGTIRRRSEELLKLVGLEKRAKESVRRFSKGMYQRLGLAQALLHDPDLLILDEPTDGLDPVGRTEVRKVIERMRDVGKTIFLNSHILQEVEMVCSRVAIMSQGTLRGLGTVEELRGDGHGDVVLLKVKLLLTRYRDLLDIHDPTEDFAQVCSHLAETLRTAGFDIETVTPHDEGPLCTLTGRVDRQAGSDALVDWLRSKSISLMELSAHRPSLEDTFLRLVDTPSDESGA